jgi:hypothetical protein
MEKVTLVSLLAMSFQTKRADLHSFFQGKVVSGMAWDGNW